MSNEQKEDIKDLYDKVDEVRREIRDQSLEFNDLVNDKVLVISEDISSLKTRYNLLEIKIEKTLQNQERLFEIIAGNPEGKMGMSQKLNFLWNFAAIITLTGITAIVNGLVNVGAWFKHLFDK